MAEARSNDDATSTPEPHRSIQSEGGLGRPEVRQDPGRAGPAVRCPSQPDRRLEDAASVFGEEKAEQRVKVDVTRMQAKIGELTLEKDFLETALIQAGLLSAKR